MSIVAHTLSPQVRIAAVTQALQELGGSHLSCGGYNYDTPSYGINFAITAYDKLFRVFIPMSFQDSNFFNEWQRIARTIYDVLKADPLYTALEVLNQ